jgi:hypothetical protein
MPSGRYRGFDMDTIYDLDSLRKQTEAIVAMMQKLGQDQTLSYRASYKSMVSRWLSFELAYQRAVRRRNENGK